MRIGHTPLLSAEAHETDDRANLGIRDKMPVGKFDFGVRSDPDIAAGLRIIERPGGIYSALEAGARNASRHLDRAVREHVKIRGGGFDQHLAIAALAGRDDAPVFFL
jgi:hypothetical protein